MQGPAARWRLNDGKMPSSHCLRVEKEGEVRLRRRFTRATRMWPLWSGDILVADVKPPASAAFPFTRAMEGSAPAAEGFKGDKNVRPSACPLRQPRQLQVCS